MPSLISLALVLVLSAHAAPYSNIEWARLATGIANAHDDVASHGLDHISEDVSLLLENDNERPDESKPRLTPNPNPSADLINRTDNLLFDIPLFQFITIRTHALHAPSPETGDLDFASDGCSSAPDHPFHFDFEPACRRHDFGYRNYKSQGRNNGNSRKKIDDNLLHDLLKDICGPLRKARKHVCKDVAQMYYRAVRRFGGKHMGVEDKDDIVERVVGEMKANTDAM